MINIILGMIVAVAVFAALRYIVNAKKQGKACIGCPYGGQCSKKGHCDHK